ncbi:hypothetical protein [Clostridium ihumii]|nr:hypothetical protein [Clostridium ihumii]
MPYATVIITLFGTVLIMCNSIVISLRKLFKESIVDSVRGIE